MTLKDSRRVYVEYKLDDRGGRLADELETTNLRPVQTYPELEDGTGVVWYRPYHLNRHLGLTPTSLHWWPMHPGAQLAKPLENLVDGMGFVIELDV